MAGKLNSEYRMFGKKRGNKLKRMSWRSEFATQEEGIAEREYVEMQDKKALTKKVRAWEKTHSAYLRTINPYATKHNDDMLATIRSERQTFAGSSKSKK